MRTLFWLEENAQNVFHYHLRTFIRLFLKLRTALLTGPAENCPIFSPCSETVLGFGWRFQNSFMHCSRHNIFMALKFGGLLDDRCSFSSICGLYRGVVENTVTHAMRAEPHASCWICSVWQQSAALFHELWKHKLIKKTSITVCNNITTKITSQWRHCRIKLALIFGINENLTKN